MSPNAKRRTRLGDRARRARPLAFAIHLTRGVGWAGIVLGFAVAVIDSAGLAELWLRAELQQRLSQLGSTAEFDALHVDWLGPGVTFEGFRVTKGEVTHLVTDRLYVAMGLSPSRGLTLTRLDLDGGVLRIHEPLLDDVRALLELRTETEQQARPNDLRLPSVQVRGFRVDFEGPEGVTHSLGSIDFSLDAQPKRPARISGRLTLPHRAEAARPPELYLHGVANRSGKLELFASAKNLAIEDWQMPQLAPLERVIAMQPAGRFQLQSSARLDLFGERQPDVELRFALEGAALHPEFVEAPLEALNVRFSARHLPSADASIADAQTWSGGGTFSATWASQAIDGGVRLGSSARPGSLWESWLHAPHLDVETPEIVALRPRVQLIENLYDSLRPSGQIEAALGITCRDDWQFGEPIEPKLEYTARVVPESRVLASWNGWALPEFPDLVPLSFAMPAVTDSGAVIVARNARFPRRSIVDVDFEATHPSGTARVTYQSWSHPVDMPPFAPGYGRFEADLFVIVPSIAIDERMREHMYGLRQVKELETLFDDYDLQDGNAGVTLHVSSRARHPLPAVEVIADIENVEATWSELPVPAHELGGRLRVLTSGTGIGAVSYDLECRTDSAQSVHIVGRQRHRSATRAEAGTAAAPELQLDALRLEAQALDLTGSDIARLVKEVPELGEALSEFAPEGQADITLLRSRSSKSVGARSAIEVTPRPGLRLLPKAFPMNSSDIRGRVLVEVDEEPRPTGELPIISTTTRIAPLIGSWQGDVLVSLQGEFRRDEPGHGTVRGAGLRHSERGLVAELTSALQSDKEAAEFELDGLELGGAIDVSYSFRLPALGSGEETSANYTIFLRDNDLKKEAGLSFEHLAGVLALDDGELHSPLVRADLNGTPVSMTDLSIASRDDELELTAVLNAEALSLDRKLLAQFLDDQTVATLVDEFKFRGSIDIDAASLRLTHSPDGVFEMVLTGDGKLSDVYAEIGLPLSIRSAQLDLEELVISDGELRGWGRVHDLYGLVLDRDLSQASMLLSYYGSRLSVDTLEGNFCQGLIHGTIDASSAASSSGPVFAVDLREPYAFQANLAIEEVDVSLLLEDVFASEIANRGRVSGEVRLQGKLANLLSISGRGQGEINDSVLWSVPVLRDLFSQLGYDASAIFDDMSTEFRIADGLVYMEDMKVHSPVLNLSGRGTLGLDGELHHDLQVKYSLVDKAGPLGSLIHLLQNTLLSVSIRGDMARPKVFLRGALTGPFQNVDEDWRAIPLPGYSPLPDRF